MKHTPPFLNLVKYGLIAFPLAFVGLPIYLHAPDFYAVTMDVPIELIGLALLLLRLFDAIQDPFIGSLSDKYHHRRGAIITGGAALLTIGLWMIFHPLASIPLAWLCLSVLIATTGFSIVSINVQALGGLWNVEKSQVTKIMATRESIGLVGLLIASITPPILLMQYDAPTSFHIVTIAFIPLIIVTVSIFLSWLKKADIKTASDTTPFPFADILKNKTMRGFILPYIFGSIATAIPGVLIIFYVRDYLQAESYLGLFLIVYFLSGAIFMPLWQYLSKRISPQRAWFYSMVLAFVTFIWAFFLQPQDIVGFALICLFSGIAVGANLALPPAIIANIIAQSNHEQAAARYYAVMAFITKACLAMATGIVLPVLGWAGYQPGEISDGILLPLAYAIIPCVFQIIAICMLWRFLYRFKG